MANGTWRSPSMKVRFPRGSAIFGRLTIWHCFKSINNVGSLMCDAACGLGFVVVFLPFLDLCFGKLRQWQQPFAASGPIPGLQDKVDHVNRLSADDLARKFRLHL